MMAPGGPLRQRRNGRESCGVQSHDIEGFGSLISLRQQAFSRSVHLLDFANGSRAALARSTLTLRGRGLQLGQFPRVESSRFAEAGAASLVWKQVLARHVLILPDEAVRHVCRANMQSFQIGTWRKNVQNVAMDGRLLLDVTTSISRGLG
jgi:hypothetical protein